MLAKLGVIGLIVVVGGCVVGILLAHEPEPCACVPRSVEVREMTRGSARDAAASDGLCATGHWRREMPDDPWKHPYVVSCTANGGAVAISVGPDEELGTLDDVVAYAAKSLKPQRSW